MKVDRVELENYLLTKCEKVAMNNEKCENTREYLLEKYAIPYGITMDMIARGKLSEQNDHILFCLLDGLLQVLEDKEETRNNILEKFYSSVEVKTYSTTKKPDERIKFPLVIKCHQVTEDQWIGVTDTEWFMKLRESQLINYNEETQRTLTHKIKNGNDFYSVTVKRPTVEGIRKRLRNGEYIPTPITLNIPVDDESADFYYDSGDNTLIINKLRWFDICDGYHRYVAMREEKDENPEFNYNWELRIINFTEERAKYFVYQEAQRARLSKADANTMDIFAVSNRIADGLNKDSTFNLFGEINNSGGNIPLSAFVKAVNYFYANSKEYKNENIFRLNVIKDLREKFNYLTNVNDKYLTQKYSFLDIIIILYIFTKDVEMNNMDGYIQEMVKRADKIDKRKVRLSRNITKNLISDLDKIFAEVQ